MGKGKGGSSVGAKGMDSFYITFTQNVKFLLMSFTCIVKDL